MHLEDHPVVTQLNSLKAAFDRVQDELHRNSVKLQSHYFKTSNEHDRIQHLEQENKALKDELAILRQTPHPDTLPQSHPAVPQVQQLTLSLRKLSDQLSSTEEILLQRTNELVNAKSDVVKAKLSEEKAYELAARIRGREQASKERQRELEWKLRSLEEQEKMSDIAMKEYANLVRSLEAKMGKGRPSTSSSGSRNSSSTANAPTLEASFAESKRNLKRLMDDMHGEIGALHARVEELQSEKEGMVSELDAQAKSCEADRLAQSQAQFELDKLKVDDNTATKMVARYMKFSQLQTDTLQTTISTLKSRHAASIDSLSSQLYTLSNQLQASQASLERFQTALDELGGDIMRESFGRRNEVALRIKMAGREERLSEELGRWARKAEERRADDGILDEMIQGAKAILSSLDAPHTLPLLFLPDDAASSNPSNPTQLNGTLGRLVTAQYLVDQLKDELQYELSCKLRLRRLVAELGGDVSLDDEFLPEDVWVPPEGWMSEVPLPSDRAPSPANTTTTAVATVAAPSTAATATTGSTKTATLTTATTSPVPVTTPSPEATTTLSPKAQQAANSLLLELEALELEVTHVDVGRGVSPSPAPPAPPSDGATPLPTRDVDGDEDKNAGIDEEGDREDGELESNANASTPRVESSISLELSPSKPEPGVVEYREEDEKEGKAVGGGEQTVVLEEEEEEGKKEEEDIAAEDTAPSPVNDEGSIPVPVPVPVIIDTSVVTGSAEEEQDEEDGDDIGGDKAASQSSAGMLTPLANSIPLVSISQPDSFDDRLEDPVTGLIPQSAPAVLHSTRSVSPPSQPVADSVQSTSSSTSAPALASSTSTEIAAPETSEIESTPFTHPLLPELAKTSRRYDDLQRSFKDCHLSLQSLKSSITTASSNAIPREILEAILERLNDFVEDARVELEIRKSDEAVLCKGYETLLSVPGALEGYSSALPGSALSSSGFGLGLMSPPASASGSLSASVSSFFSPLRSAPAQVFRSQTPTNGHANRNGNGSAMGLGDVEDQIQAFIDGTEPSIVKAMEGFRRKLGDVEHDIAALKMAVHQDSSSSPLSPSSPLSEENAQPQSQSASQESKFQSESGLLSPTPRCQRLFFVACIITSATPATTAASLAEFDLRKRNDQSSVETFTFIGKYAEETA
ncbi:hypothetical protein H1R20_g11375, partial [Candolleomyces eurysporus]